LVAMRVVSQIVLRIGLANQLTMFVPIIPLALCH